MGEELHELLGKLENQQTQRSIAQKELEAVKKERNFLAESIKELRAMFENYIAQ
jgi:cell division protein FtsB